MNARDAVRGHFNQTIEIVWLETALLDLAQHAVHERDNVNFVPRSRFAAAIKVPVSKLLPLL